MSGNDKIKVLEIKSKENYKCALLACNKGLNNCAVSRYYYSCLLVSLRCAYENGWISDQDILEHKSSTHQLIENCFVKRILQNANTSYENVAKLKYFSALKSHRIKAEYYYDVDYSTEKGEFESAKNFAQHFLSVVNDLFNINIMEG